MKILLAVDGSTFTNIAAKYLVTHLESFQSLPELHLLYVQIPIPAMSESRGRIVLGDDAVDNYYKEETKAALAPAEKLFRKHKIPFQSSYKIGQVSDEIKQYASKNKIDMIVMGSHGHGALANLVLGSVATKILATTTVPVLIVR